LDLEEEKERDAIATVAAAAKKAAAEAASAAAKAKRLAAAAAAANLPLPLTTTTTTTTSEFDFITMTTASPQPIPGKKSGLDMSSSSSSQPPSPSPENSPAGSGSDSGGQNGANTSISIYTPPGTGPGSNGRTALIGVGSGRLPSTSPPLDIEPRRRIFQQSTTVNASSPIITDTLSIPNNNIINHHYPGLLNSSHTDSPVSSGTTTPTGTGTRSAGPSSSPPSPGTAAIIGVIDSTTTSTTTVITSTSEDDMSVLLSSLSFGPDHRIADARGAPTLDTDVLGAPRTKRLGSNENNNTLLHRRSQSDMQLSDHTRNTNNVNNSNIGSGITNVSSSLSSSSTMSMRARGLSDAFVFEDLDSYGEARGQVRADDGPIVVPPSPGGSGSRSAGHSGPSTPIDPQKTKRRFGPEHKTTTSSGLHDALTANKPSVTPAKR
jgi:hypothetical protein